MHPFIILSVSLSLILTSASSLTEAPQIPKSKDCAQSELDYDIGKTAIRFIRLPYGCALQTTAKSVDSRRENIISTTSHGLVYFWNIPSVEHDDSNGPRSDYKHVVAFLPVKDHPFPHPSPDLPKFMDENEAFLHLPNGENLIIDTAINKVKWRKSFELGISSILMDEIEPSQKSPRMLKINRYAENQIYIDFGASATTDPFLQAGAMATMYRFAAGESRPRICRVPSKLFRHSAEDFEAHFDNSTMAKVLSRCRNF